MEGVVEFYDISDTNCLIDVLNMLEAGIPTTFIHVFVHLTGKYPEELIAITVEEAASSGLLFMFYGDQKETLLQITDDGRGILQGVRLFNDKQLNE